MYPPQDKLQYPIPGRKYKFLDWNDTILATDLTRFFIEGYPKGWQSANYVMPYWVGKTVSNFARGVYKIVNSNRYTEWFEIIRDSNIITIKI